MRRRISMASVVDELSKENEVKDSLRKKLRNPEVESEVSESDDLEDLEDLDTSEFTDDDLDFMYEDEEDYDEDDLYDEEEDREAQDEPDEEDNDKSLDLIKDTSETLETIIDELSDNNEDRQYSKVLQLLKAAVRVLDEMQQSDKLINEVYEEK